MTEEKGKKSSVTLDNKHAPGMLLVQGKMSQLQRRTSDYVHLFFHRL